MPQFVYLDESGDTGFRFEKGSSRYFVVTLLIVSDPLPIHAMVGELRAGLGYRPDSEFNFSSSTPNVRRRFLQAVCRKDILVRALVVDKHRLTQPGMRKREGFYNELVRMILQNDQGRLRDATLILDQREKSKRSQQSAASFFRRELNNLGAGTEKPRRISEIRYHDSRQDNLLQVVDMISGAINHRFSRDDGSYLALVRPRLDDLWEWPPGELTQ